MEKVFFPTKYGLQIMVSKQGRRKLIPWCWIVGLRQAGYYYANPM